MDYMARDQYGQTFHGLGPHPRAALMRRLGRKHAAKMYHDDKAGKSYHVGYVIGGRWLSLYRVEPMRVAL